MGKKPPISVDWASRRSRQLAQLDSRTIQSWVRTTLAYHPCHRLTSLALRFVGDEEMRLLNQRYRQRDYPTNVLTFTYRGSTEFVYGNGGPEDGSAPNSASPGLREIAGEAGWHSDIAIAPAVLMKEALAQGCSFTRHCAHIVVHGTLHALGHDHETPREARIMESLEALILQQIGP